MKSLRTSLLIGVTALSLGASLTAVADPAPAGQAPARMARMAEHFAQRQDQLHTALQLSPAQEAAWNTYQAALRPQTPPARPDRAAMPALPAPERMQHMLDRAKLRTARMEVHVAAVTAFYAQLTDAQKQTFDQFTRRHGQRQRRG